MTLFLFILIVGLGVYRLVRYYLKVKKYYKVTATVIGNDVREVEDALMGSKYYYSPIIAFTDKNNQYQQLISNEDNPDRPLYKQGTTITILVNPDDSNRFIMYDFIDGYVIPIIWIIIGTAVLLIPIIFEKEFSE